jgi:CheY-like chemotaxis protein
MTDPTSPDETRADTVAFVFDVDRAMLENQTLPGLRHHGLEEHGIELRPYTNRNTLLAAIAREPRPSVALVDLQLDERFDHNWSGHRIIETIRCHPALRRNCRPLALTIHSRPAIRRLVEAHGGYGIVCRGEIDRGAEFDLAGMLRLQSRRSAWGPEREVTCEVIPNEKALGEIHDTEAEAKELRAVQRIFERTRTLNEKQWMAMRYFAVNLDHISVAQLLEVRFRDLKDGGSVVEGLQKALRPVYRQHGPDVYRASLDLFEAVPDKRPIPTLELSFNELPRLNWIRDMKAGELAELSRIGFLDEEAEKILKHVLYGGAPDEWPSGAAGQSVWLTFVRQRLSTLEPPPIADGTIPPAELREAFEQRCEAHLIRAVHNLLDTSAAKHAD